MSKRLWTPGHYRWVCQLLISFAWTKRQPPLIRDVSLSTLMRNTTIVRLSSEYYRKTSFNVRYSFSIRFAILLISISVIIANEVFHMHFICFVVKALARQKKTSAQLVVSAVLFFFVLSYLFINKLKKSYFFFFFVEAIALV